MGNIFDTPEVATKDKRKPTKPSNSKAAIRGRGSLFDSEETPSSSSPFSSFDQIVQPTSRASFAQTESERLTTARERRKGLGERLLSSSPGKMLFNAPDVTQGSFVDRAKAQASQGLLRQIMRPSQAVIGALHAPTPLTHGSFANMIENARSMGRGALEGIQLKSEDRGKDVLGDLMDSYGMDRAAAERQLHIPGTGHLGIPNLTISPSGIAGFTLEAASDPSNLVIPYALKGAGRGASAIGRGGLGLLDFSVVGRPVATAIKDTGKAFVTNRAARQAVRSAAKAERQAIHSQQTGSQLIDYVTGAIEYTRKRRAPVTERPPVVFTTAEDLAADLAEQADIKGLPKFIGGAVGHPHGGGLSQKQIAEIIGAYSDGRDISRAVGFPVNIAPRTSQEAREFIVQYLDSLGYSKLTNPANSAGMSIYKVSDGLAIRNADPLDISMMSAVQHVENTLVPGEMLNITSTGNPTKSILETIRTLDEALPGNEFPLLPTHVRRLIPQLNLHSENIITRLRDKSLSSAIPLGRSALHVNLAANPLLAKTVLTAEDMATAGITEDTIRALRNIGPDAIELMSDADIRTLVPGIQKFFARAIAAGEDVPIGDIPSNWKLLTNDMIEGKIRRLQSTYNLTDEQTAQLAGQAGFGEWGALDGKYVHPMVYYALNPDLLNLKPAIVKGAMSTFVDSARNLWQGLNAPTLTPLRPTSAPGRVWNKTLSYAKAGVVPLNIVGQGVNVIGNYLLGHVLGKVPATKMFEYMAEGYTDIAKYRGILGIGGKSKHLADEMIRVGELQLPYDQRFELANDLISNMPSISESGRMSEIGIPASALEGAESTGSAVTKGIKRVTTEASGNVFISNEIAAKLAVGKYHFDTMSSKWKTLLPELGQRFDEGMGRFRQELAEAHLAHDAEAVAAIEFGMKRLANQTDRMVYKELVKRAAVIAETAIFDYNDIPRWMEWSRMYSPLLPFPTFLGKVAESLPRAAMENPKALNNLTRFWRDAESESNASPEQVELEKSIMPGYEQNNAPVRTTATDEYGRPVYFRSGRVDPFRGLATPMSADSPSDLANPKTWFAAGPALEALTNETSYGAPVTEQPGLMGMFERVKYAGGRYLPSARLIPGFDTKVATNKETWKNREPGTEEQLGEKIGSTWFESNFRSFPFRGRTFAKSLSYEIDRERKSVIKEAEKIAQQKGYDSADPHTWPDDAPRRQELVNRYDNIIEEYDALGQVMQKLYKE